MSKPSDSGEMTKFYAWVILIGVSILIWLWICGCPAIIHLLTQ